MYGRSIRDATFLTELVEPTGINQLRIYNTLQTTLDDHFALASAATLLRGGKFVPTRRSGRRSTATLLGENLGGRGKGLRP